MLLINDGAGPVAIAGVMGGLESEIGASTRRVLLECAYFQPASIRRTSKKLGLSTEASYRFERGADWNGPLPAIARTCYLIEQLAGGRIAGSLQDVYPTPIAPIEIELDRKHARVFARCRLDALIYRIYTQAPEFQAGAQREGQMAGAMSYLSRGYGTGGRSDRGNSTLSRLSKHTHDAACSENCRGAFPHSFIRAGRKGNSPGLGLQRKHQSEFCRRPG